MRRIREVQQKVIDGVLAGVDGEPVNDVVFAVPEDIRPDVIRLAGNHGLADMVYETGIPISAEEGASLVKEGMTRVGPSRLTAFFGELMCGAVAAGALHAAVHGFLWYRSKEFDVAVAETDVLTARLQSVSPA